MNFKRILIGLCLATTVGVGAIAGFGVNKSLKAAKAENGDPADYYLVGEGSFATADWTTAGGVRMVTHDMDLGVVYHQLLTEGDVFQGRHATNEWWYGYSDIIDGRNFFGETVSGNVLYDIKGTIFDNAYWSPSTQDGAPNYIEKGTTFPVYIKVSNDDWASANAKFGFRSYNDDTGTVYVGTKISGEYGTSGLVVRVNVPVVALNYGFQIVRLNSTAVEGTTYANKDYIWTFSSTCESNGEGTQGKFQTNLNKVYVKTTGYYDIYLAGEPGKFYIYDSIQQWINSYMHMDANVTNQCMTYYGDAKTALLALGSDAVTHFSSNAGSKYTAALARYNAWAAARGDANPFTNGGVGSRAIASINESNSKANAIILVSAISLVSIGGFFFLRKRKVER